MSYKYKEKIKEDLKHLLEGVSIDYYSSEELIYKQKVKELDRVYAQAPKADEYEAKNKELLEELKYLKKVNNDLVWQRDTDEEHEAKAKAWDKYKTHMESHIAGEINEEELVSDLKSDYFESGELNAKK